jgi:hypothetical protein
MTETATLGDANLDRALTKPHRFVKTYYGSLMWCGQHEMMHAGQIGLLRRLLGYPPIW